MSDLLQRLKEIGDNTGEVDSKTISRLVPECAAEIERLTAENERLRKALEVFAEYEEKHVSIPAMEALDA